MRLDDEQNQASREQDQIQDAKRNEKNKAGKKLKDNIKKAITALVTSVFFKLISTILVLLVLHSIITTLIESIFSTNTPEAIYEGLEVDNLADLVEIKGNSTGGYYLDFKEGTDEKLVKIVKQLEKSAGVKSIDIDLLKKMIMAEVITQFPNLGGKNTYSVSSSVDAFLAEAKKIADYVRDNDFEYGNATTNPAINHDEKLVSCDRYVGWVLYNIGYTDQPVDAGLTVHVLAQYAEEKGWEKIETLSEVQAGDIVYTVYKGDPIGHVFICAGESSTPGNYLRYDCGSIERINGKKGQQPFDEPINNFTVAYRPDFGNSTTGTGGIEYLTAKYEGGKPDALGEYDDNWGVRKIWI